MDLDLTADQHHGEGIKALIVARQQPNTQGAANYAAIAAAHFAAAQLIVTRYPDGVHPSTGADRAPEQCRWLESYR